MGFEPKFNITAETLRLVAEATELRAWIAAAVVDVPWLPALQRDTTARLAHSSTSIEGNPLTLPEVEALARGEPIGAERRAALEVLNALAAMRWIWRQVEKNKIQDKGLLRLHRLLTVGLLPEKAVGAYKSVPNRVIDHRGHPIYIPPRPKDAPRLTRELFAWLNGKGGRCLHPVVVAAIAHHQLVSIHPVSDGNGRLARALEVWILYSRGFDTHHLFSLDDYFWADRPLYYLKIQQARDLDDDLTHWVEYVAQGVVSTLKETVERIRSLQVRPPSSKILLTKRQEDLLRYLRDRGVVTSADIQTAFKFTRARAGQILKPLVYEGLVEVVGRQRSARYRLAK
ncbi:MAG: Fic family protein [Elusimicrobia bacterium]|nr:Fic family protein [Elusimicrobiota bacterium]